jgi:hypothetical protein
VIWHHFYNKDFSAVFLIDVFHQLFESLFHSVYQHFSVITWAENKMVVNQRYLHFRPSVWVSLGFNCINILFILKQQKTMKYPKGTSYGCRGLSGGFFCKAYGSCSVYKDKFGYSVTVVSGHIMYRNRSTCGVTHKCEVL